MGAHIENIYIMNFDMYKMLQTYVSNTYFIYMFIKTTYI